MTILITVGLPVTMSIILSTLDLHMSVQKHAVLTHPSDSQSKRKEGKEEERKEEEGREEGRERGRKRRRRKKRQRVEGRERRRYRGGREGDLLHLLLKCSLKQFD